MNSKGIGLGLHIFKKITKMFDGDIVCRSEYGHGSNFIFLVALCNNFKNGNYKSVSNYRIKNPNKKLYEKIDFKL